MNLARALSHLTHIQETTGNQRQLRLVVPLHQPGTIGCQPSTEVEYIQAGFDWDAGVVFLRTKQQLTTLTPEQVEDISRSVSQGSSWHAYQREKHLRAQIAAQRQLLERIRPEMTAEDLAAWCRDREAPLQEAS